jgi:hypothetical protein
MEKFYKIIENFPIKNQKIAKQKKHKQKPEGR